MDESRVSDQVRPGTVPEDVGVSDLAHRPTVNESVRPILEVDNLKMYFPVKSSGVIRRTVAHVQAVDGVSFQVPKGGALGLVGES